MKGRRRRRPSFIGCNAIKTHDVMAGLVPAIHAFLCRKQGVDARHKAGHDEREDCV
jgi:hypothetical protein